MKKTIAKILALLLCAVLLVSGSVFITLALLHDSTNVVRNTFTSANINIRLEETKVDEFGKAIAGAAKVSDEQNYRLIPGEEYLKDPTVYVEANSENCFVVIAIYDTMFKDTGIEANYNSKGTIYDQLATYNWKPFESGTFPQPELADSFFESKLDDEGKETNHMAKWRTVTENSETGLEEETLFFTLYYYAGASNNLETATILTSKTEIALPIFDGFKLKAEMSDAESVILGDAEGKSLEIIAFAFQDRGYGNLDGKNIQQRIATAFNANFGNPTIDNSQSGGIGGA